jgi:hypothetical protein
MALGRLADDLGGELLDSDVGLGGEGHELRGGVGGRTVEPFGEDTGGDVEQRPGGQGGAELGQFVAELPNGGG